MGIFVVYDNGEPATLSEREGWVTNTFDTFDKEVFK